MVKKTKKQKEEFSKFNSKIIDQMLEASHKLSPTDLEKFKEDQERERIIKYNSIYKTNIDPDKVIEYNKRLRESY